MEKATAGKANEPKQWWQNPATVTVLVAIVAAVAPLTGAIQGSIQARNQVELEKNKQLHEMRQKYLDRLLSETGNRRVLEFLVTVEEDQKLKAWAQTELKKTEGRIETKQELYGKAITVVAKLANLSGSIDRGSGEYKQFWELYNEKLLPVESPEVESLMVAIGRELEALSSAGKTPSNELRQLSFRLASKMKEELREARS